MKFSQFCFAHNVVCLIQCNLLNKSGHGGHKWQVPPAANKSEADPWSIQKSEEVLNFKCCAKQNVVLLAFLSVVFPLYI